MNMKLAKLVSFFSLSVALSLSGTGCRKGLDKTTHIPGGKQPTFTDSAAPAIGGGTPIDGTGTGTGTGTVVTGGGLTDGIPATKGDFTGWPENREEFAAQTIYFDFDKSVVKASEVGKLEQVASRMKSNFQGKALRIEGHCDERGTEEYNRALGDKRALSIREKLVQLGLDPEMLPTVSFGEDKPVDTGHDDSAYTRNRRGELILLSPPGSN
jgi:peptidoglycan-associated lipoprotein